MSSGGNRGVGELGTLGGGMGMRSQDAGSAEGRLLSVGLTNEEIAARPGLSENTVAFHVANLLGKLVAPNRVEVAERVRALGL